MTSDNSIPTPSDWLPEDEGVVAFDVNEDFHFRDIDPTAPDQWFVKINTGRHRTETRVVLYNPARNETISLEKIIGTRVEPDDTVMMFSLRGMYAAMEMYRAEHEAATPGGYPVEDEDDAD